MHNRQHQLALLEAVTGATDVMLAYLDPDFRFVWVNAPYARTCGLRPDEMTGRMHFELFPNAENEAIFTRVRDTGEAVFYKDKAFEFSDQPERGVTYWDWSLAPVKDAAGQVEGLVLSLRDTTDYRRAERRLAEQQRDLYQFVEQAPVSIAMFDRSMNCLAYSQRWLLDYGRGLADLHGRNHYQIHPDLPEEWKAVHQRALAGETIKKDEDHWRQSDGQEHWLRWAVVPWRNEKGEIGGIIMSADNITDQTRARVDLAEGRARLAGIIDSAMDAIISVDQSYRIRLFNPAAESAFGCRAEDVLGQTLERFIPLGLERQHEAHMRQFAASGLIQRRMGTLGDLKARRWDGTEFPFEGSISQVSVAGQRLFTVILRDITERKRAEAALRESEEKFRSAFANAAIGFAMVTPEGMFVDANPAYCTLTGYTLEELRQQAFASLVHPDDYEVNMALTRDMLDGRITDFVVENRYRRKDGDTVWVRKSVSVVRDVAGKPRWNIALVEDVTARKRTELELAQARAAAEDRAAELEAVLQAVPAAVWIAHDPDCLSITGNRTANELLRLPPDAEASLTAKADLRPVHFRVFHQGRELPGDMLPMQRAARGEEVRDFEEQIVFADGAVVTALGNATPLRNERGAPRGCVGAFVDISARKYAEEAMREADRRKDEFLAMLAHELRNPLAPIRNAAHILGQLKLNEPRVDWARGVIERQVEQLIRLVDDLLDVSRIVRNKITLRQEPLELSELFQRAIEASQPLLESRGHHLETRLPNVPVRLVGDMARLTQVLVNLLDNAAKYTGIGGVVVLEAVLEDRLLAIRVRDNGMGIPQDLLPHVFDLFRQSERASDRAQGGLGIGLTVVRSLVEMAGGQVTATSPGPGMGSTFTIRLPVSTPPAANGLANTDTLPSQAQTGKLVTITPKNLKVLLVDDDAAVADSTAVFLELEGCNVRHVADGASALRAVAEFRPRLVLLDIGLPDQNGYDVASQIRQLPGGDQILLVAVTGYGQLEDQERSRREGFDRHLTKPVDPHILSNLLADAAASDD